jgi:hypothetical protein
VVRHTRRRSWPFFAPSDRGAIAEALDLVGLAADEHLVDLGCGDGRVLVEAARRGAWVVGVESDPALAAAAVKALRSAGLSDRGEVITADLFDVDPWASQAEHADVLFSYLSPALLQRLTPRLRRLAGARLVAVDFELPDLLPDGAHGAARLYQLPGRRRPARRNRQGWSGDAGTLCVMPAERSSLTCLRAIHGGGRVQLSLSGQMARCATALVGTDETEPGRPVAIDIRWGEHPAGTLAKGQVRLAGLPAHPVFVLFAADGHGQWNLSTDGCRALAFRLRRRSLPGPTTTAELLAAARGRD